MKSAFFHFFDSLNDFLPLQRKNVRFEYPFQENPSVKHLIEALGVPHTEVFQIVANQEPVDFSYLVKDGDRIEVYPTLAEGENGPGSLIPENHNEPGFILDNHLGRLAAYLRMLGFDVLYSNRYQDQELAEIANREMRILLTRDRHLLMRNAILYGYFIRSQDPKEQMLEVLHHYNLTGHIHPFRRCLRCNTPLTAIPKEEVLPLLEPLTQKYFNEFHICPNCHQIYWKGSHYERMLKLVDLAYQR